MTAKQQTINCSERLSLGQKLGQAINYAYAARTDCETAKASKADPDRLAICWAFFKMPEPKN